ncbi:MAG: TRAP transporter substrate-binding protein DctP [Limisphaerales bacterium]
MIEMPPTNVSNRMFGTKRLWIGLMAVVAVFQMEAQTIRLATLAPSRTSMHKSLLKMGSEWKKAGVRLQIFTDGKMGGESQMIRRMRVNQIQASLLSVQGLTVIDESAKSVQLVPMMFRDLKEFDYALEKVRPIMEAKMEKKGYKVLFWSDIGYLRMFTTKKAMRIDDMRKLRMYVWSGDTQTQGLMKIMRCRGVPLEQTEVLTGLQTGMFDMITMPPVMALSGQIYRNANNMLNLNWNPLVGALVVNKKTWDRIPRAKREKLVAAAKVAGDEIRAAGRRESEAAVKAMESRGLKVNSPDDADVADWEKFAAEMYPIIRGKIVDAKLFDALKAAVLEYRAKSK